MSAFRYTWARILIELATRALRRVHHDYLLWSVNQDWSTEPSLLDLNIGLGIEFADEKSVCAAITQEFIYSPFSSGMMVTEDITQGIHGGHRFFRLFRERLYPHCEEKKFADIVLERVDPISNVPFGPPVYIEAKRAFIWSTKLDGELPRPTKNAIGVQKDIKKLRDYSWQGEVPYTYVLIWNVMDDTFATNLTPDEFLKDVGERIEIRQTRWVPVSWDQKDGNSSDPPKVTRWMWVCLAEIPRGSNLPEGS